MRVLCTSNLLSKLPRDYQEIGWLSESAAEQDALVTPGKAYTVYALVILGSSVYYYICDDGYAEMSAMDFPQEHPAPLFELIDDRVSGWWRVANAVLDSGLKTIFAPGLCINQPSFFERVMMSEEPEVVNLWRQIKSLIDSEVLGGVTVDISPAVLDAKSRTNAWSEAKFLETLAEVGSLLPGSEVDWDNGVPEEWGRVLWKERSVVIIRAREPFAIIARGLPGEVADRLRDNQVTAVELDWDIDRITLDRDVANNTPPSWNVSECIDPADPGISLCTVQDLYVMSIG